MDNKQNSHALPTQEQWIKLSFKEIKHIFIYYAVLFIASVVVCAILISKISLASDEQGSVFQITKISFSFGLLGSTFYYIRKLYKSCIQLLVVPNKAEDQAIAGLGAKVYFLVRPIFGAILAVLILLGIYAGLFFLQDTPSINKEKLNIFSAIISFVVGFTNGKFIVKLDSNSDKIPNLIRITKEKKE